MQKIHTNAFTSSHGNILILKGDEIFIFFLSNNLVRGEHSQAPSNSHLSPEKGRRTMPDRPQWHLTPPDGSFFFGAYFTSFSKIEVSMYS